MENVTTIAAVRKRVAAARALGWRIGFVPTMGALHAGHTSLIEAATGACGFVVVSIFVNPTQFGPNEDWNRYPRPLETDLDLCRHEGVDLVFSPEVAEIYPVEFHTFVTVETLTDGLCGVSRPGHFRGVATVVLKLFNIVQPDVAYFGQKDAQQARVIQQMVRDLDVPVQVHVCPIVREPDGLALSSRNRYLDERQRAGALALHRSLTEARALIEAGERDAGRVRQAMAACVAAVPGAALDYAEVVAADTLKPLARIEGSVLIAVAVRFGATRLIDNILLTIAS